MVTRAYSTQRKRMMTAGEANELALKHILSDPKAFQCSKTCTYPLTCANFNKTITEQMRAPYFTSGDHSDTRMHDDGCDYLIHSQDKHKNRRSFSYSKQQQQKVVTLELSIDGFQPISRPRQNIQNKEFNSKNYTSKDHVNHSRNGQQSIHINSLQQLVTYYHQEPSLPVTVNGKEYSIEKLFCNVDDAKYLSRDKRIFFGKCWVNSIKSKDLYQLKFVSSCKFEGLHQKPSLIISNKNIISKHLKRLKNHIDSGENTPIPVYIWGHCSKSSKFINIEYDWNVHNLYIPDFE